MFRSFIKNGKERKDCLVLLKRTSDQPWKKDAGKIGFKEKIHCKGGLSGKKPQRKVRTKKKKKQEKGLGGKKS